MFLILPKKIEWRPGRHVQKGAVFRRPFQLHMQVRQRGIPVMADMVVEFFVFLIGDLFLVRRPDGLHGIEGFFLDNFSGLAAIGLSLYIEHRFRSFDIHQDRIGNKIGVLFYDAADGPFFGEVLFIFFRLLQGQDDCGPARILFRLLNRVGPVPGRNPFGGLVAAGGSRNEAYPAGNNKGTVETNAKLTD